MSDNPVFFSNEAVSPRPPRLTGEALKAANRSLVRGGTMNAHDEAMRDLADLYLMSDKSPKAERLYDRVGVTIINMKAERDALLAVVRAATAWSECDGCSHEEACLTADITQVSPCYTRIRTALAALPDNIKRELEG